MAQGGKYMHTILVRPNAKSIFPFSIGFIKDTEFPWPCWPEGSAEINFHVVPGFATGSRAFCLIRTFDGQGQGKSGAAMRKLIRSMPLDVIIPPPPDGVPHPSIYIILFLHIIFTKASLLAGVCFPLGMYWGQSF